MRSHRFHNLQSSYKAACMRLYFGDSERKKKKERAGKTALKTVIAYGKVPHEALAWLNGDNATLTLNH